MIHHFLFSFLSPSISPYPCIVPLVEQKKRKKAGKKARAVETNKKGKKGNASFVSKKSLAEIKVEKKTRGEGGEKKDIEKGVHVIV